MRIKKIKENAKLFKGKTMIAYIILDQNKNI